MKLDMHKQFYLWVHGYWLFSRIGIIHSFSVTVYFALKVPMTATSRDCWRCAKCVRKGTNTIPFCLANTACKEQWLSWLSKNNKTGSCCMQQVYFCACIFSKRSEVIHSLSHNNIKMKYAETRDDFLNNNLGFQSGCKYLTSYNH